MSEDQDRVGEDIQLEKTRARYGLLAVVVSNLAIAGVAAFGVWRLGGDRSVIVGVLTAAFTAVSSMTTAYLGIKAVSNTAKSIASSAAATRQAPAATHPATTSAASATSAPSTTPPAQRNQ
ncbi:hypothetical protein EDD90_5828 [Streptomyces sp. Ag109_O5-1]|uniref:hypothetical protein n=1 Tax=Streptomyces sp. Ag109_O5-1 TaxID=1938851 RepID=UPI000FA6EA3A|nr:hypothetical protein [Streptomyces sp. Ag109_O5-1]RPE42678.1 hypothetical protein EDD90_5828 [Streptomyces sp. Ag109_O5-1]